jgi:hypothetical protein
MKTGGHAVSATVPIRLVGRELRLHKAIVDPLLGTRTVLTNSPWGFVTLWLKRHRKHNALFFWDQAREFHAASAGMTAQSAPLVHYYSFMNAAKALLDAKGRSFTPYHGIRSQLLRQPHDKIDLFNEGVKILTDGVLPALSLYLGETEPHRIHSLQELLFNLPFVHRTYCLTYKNQGDMFIPLTECEWVVDTKTMQAYLRATLSKDFAHPRFIKRLPSSLIPDPLGGNIRAIRSAKSTTIASRSLRAAMDRNNVAQLHRELRRDIQYIRGAQTLWYVKGVVGGPRRLARFPLTITLAAMHRLSEICRYRPTELASFLGGQKNWLLSEFVQLAPSQFIDELAAEITGHQFLAPNVRAAT